MKTYVGELPVPVGWAEEHRTEHWEFKVSLPLSAPVVGVSGLINELLGVTLDAPYFECTNFETELVILIQGRVAE